MVDDESVPSDEDDAGVDDDVVEELRRCNPVDETALPSSRSPEAMRTLEQILDPDDEPQTESDESSCSPAEGNCGGREGPPPRPTPR